MRHRIGTCSNCDNPEAWHDYCPNCGHGDPLHAATESELERLRAELAEALKEARPCVEEIADQVDCTAPHKAAPIYALLARIDAALAKAGVR